jgi:hypothetical protein
MKVLSFPNCPAGGLNAANIETLVKGLAGGQPGIFVLVDGTGQ